LVKIAVAGRPINAIFLLRQFSVEQMGIGTNELAGMAGRDKSVAHRLLIYLQTGHIA